MAGPTPADGAIEAARSGRLRWVSDADAGIRRVRRGKAFRYVDPQGRAVRNVDALSRIRSLAIPPAWTDVWICVHESGHLQATGRDARGRKQYRYHSRWRAVRDQSKYEKTIAFARSLPRIRAAVERDLALPGLPRNKVLAAIVRLLDATLIRVGNDEYARNNDSYGLTTLQDRHARIRGGTVRFEFRGKSGVKRRIELEDPRLARIVRKCQDLPGQELFQYLDDEGRAVDVASSDVNDYLREIAGADFTAKDFRTWAGTALAAQALQEFEDFDSKAAARKNVTRAIERVAQRLGNTKAVCRKCYVHPAVIDAYLDRTLVQSLQRRAERELRDSLHWLPPEEAAVLALLQQRMEQQSARPSAPASGRARRTSGKRALPASAAAG